MMRSEVAKLLAMVTAFDRRTVGQSEVIAWHAVLDDVEFEDAAKAVIAYYRQSREWLMPSRVRELAKDARAERISAQRAIEPAPPVRATTPPDEWFDLKQKLAARPRKERESFGSAMAALAAKLDQGEVSS